MERFDIISTIGAKYHVGKTSRTIKKQLREQNTRTLTCDSRMNVLRY